MSNSSKADSPYGLFGSNENLEKSGVNIDYGPFAFTVARAGGSNKRYGERLKKILQPHRRALQTETLPDEKVQELMIQAFVEAVLLGWRSKEFGEGKIPDEEGNELVFSRENAMRLFKDLPDLFTDLSEQATKLTNFREVVDETDAGN